MMRAASLLCGVIPAVVLACPAAAQLPSQMSVGVQAPPPAPDTSGLDRLSPIERQRLLEIEQARRGLPRPGTSIDCRAAQADKPMTDLERASWRLKCGR